jgi:type IV secretion system protein VirB6
MNVFQAIDAAFQQPAIQFLERTASSLCGALADPMRAALTLYVLWFGILVLRGAVQEPISEALARILKASIITTLTLSYASYNDYVGSFFFDTLPREIAAVVGGGTPASPGRFDQLLTRTNVLVEEMWRDAGWSFGLIKAAVSSVVIYVTMGLLTAYGYFTWLFAKFALALVLGLGPMFVALALFDSTRGFAQAWLGQVVNYVILQVLSIAVLAMMLTTLEGLLGTSKGAWDATASALGIVAGGTFCFGVLWNLPAMAAALASGGAWLAVRGPAAVMRATHASTISNIESAKASGQSLAARSRSFSSGHGWFRPQAGRAVPVRSSGPTIEQQQQMTGEQRG